MTTIFKSNSVSTRSIGNISNLSDRDYALMLDFNSGLYLQKTGGTTKNINFLDALTFERGSKATYIDLSGQLKEASENEPRISFDSLTGKTGLLMERGFTNLVQNPYAPSQQSISVTQSSTDFYIVSVLGAGSAWLEGSVVQSSQGQAVENSPIEYKLVGTGEATLRIQGNPTWVGVSRVYPNIGGESLLPNSRYDATKARDTCSLSKEVFDQLIGSKSQYTILMRTIRNPKPISNQAFKTNFFRLLDTSNGDTGIYVYRTAGSTPRIETAFTEGSSRKTGFSKVMADDIREVTVAMSFDTDSSEYILAQNGEVYPSPYPDYAYKINPDKLLFGSNSNYSVGNSLNGLITQIVIYPKKMNASELQELTAK